MSTPSSPNPAPPGPAAPVTLLENFWMKPATVLDLSKWLLSLLLLIVGWGVSVEVRMARQDVTLQSINQTLASLNKSVDQFNEIKDERGQRLARIEVGVEMLRQEMRQSRETDRPVPQGRYR